MAAYAAVLSLMHTINNIRNHPRPPISLHQNHLSSLTQNLSFLQDFLEFYSDDDLESRITAAAQAAEDLIETHIVDQIEAGSTSHDGQNIRSVDFYGDLERAIQDLDLMKKEATEIVEVKKEMGSRHHGLIRTNSPAIRPARGRPRWILINQVLVNQVLDKLVGQQSSLQIIPIVGMGGIGKTTLAKHIYTNGLIVEHFDILAWVVVSQGCSSLQILLQVLGQENSGSEEALGLCVHQQLWGRKYLIVMDDMWSSEPWHRVKNFFPDNNNGSRIMITTRLSNLGTELSGSHVFHMNFLDHDKSWGLLSEIVFGKELSCPVELEDIGKKIAINCRGLPLSIVVVGGLLAKSNLTRGYWEYTSEFEFSHKFRGR